MTIDFATLYQPPSKDHIAQLEDSFKKYGIRDAVVQTHDGVIISGHLRSEIGTRLGIPFKVVKLPATATPAEQLAEAVLANKNIREPTDPKGTAEMLRNECGWSYARIGENLGVDKTTVRDWMEMPGVGNPTPGIEEEGEPEGEQLAPPVRSVGKDNKSYPGRKSTKAELARRQKAAVKLWNQGYGVTAIEKCLGIKRDMIRVDLAQAGVDLDTPRVRGLPKPEPIVWRDIPKAPKPKKAPPKPARVQRPAYQTSHVVRDLNNFLKFLEAAEEENYPGALAHNLEEARTKEDTDWEKEITQLLTAVQQTVTDLLRVMRDERYRAYRMKGNDHRDPNYGTRQSLRAVSSE